MGVQNQPKPLKLSLSDIPDQVDPFNMNSSNQIQLADVNEFEKVALVPIDRHMKDSQKMTLPVNEFEKVALVPIDRHSQKMTLPIEQENRNEFEKVVLMPIDRDKLNLRNIERSNEEENR